jgi:hypothetical protein
MICVSIDGPPDLHGYTRPGLALPRFLENLKRLQQDPSFIIHTNTALYALNALYFPETVEWILSEVQPQRLNVSLSTKLGSEHMDARVLPAALKAVAVAKIDALLARLDKHHELEAYLLQDTRTCLETVSGFLRSEDLCTPVHMSRMASYFRKLDKVHGTNLREVNPEVADLIAALPDFEGVAAMRQGPVVGMPQCP